MAPVNARLLSEISKRLGKSYIEGEVRAWEVAHKAYNFLAKNGYFGRIILKSPSGPPTTIGFLWIENKSFL